MWSCHSLPYPLHGTHTQVEGGFSSMPGQFDGERLSDVLYEKDPRGYWKKCYD